MGIDAGATVGNFTYIRVASYHTSVRFQNLSTIYLKLVYLILFKISLI